MGSHVGDRLLNYVIPCASSIAKRNGFALRVRAYCRTHGLSPIIVRASNPFGPRQAHSGIQGVISTFLRRIIDGETSRNQGRRRRCAGLPRSRRCGGALRLRRDKRQGAYNAGRGHRFSVNEVVEAVRRVTGSDFQTVYKPGRPIDVPRSVLDCSRARSDFDWECKTEFGAGLRDTWDWLKAHA